jgi:hypothetical protein
MLLDLCFEALQACVAYNEYVFAHLTMEALLNPQVSCITGLL